jgi:large subunit ribosomal protein L17
MPRPAKGARLGSGPAHERLLLAQLASQLFEHRSIQTTEAKARRLRPVAERYITFATLVAERQGGYTRIVKTGFRKGDNAPMAVIELVLEPVTPKRSTRTRTGDVTAAPAEPAESDVHAPSAESDVPVEETNTVEESAPIAPESETPAADEVEADAAETAADAPEVDGPAADEPATPDEKPATPAS